jgi:segregation and condensation protein A
MTNTFSVEAGEFKGPLESLLDLIESRKLSISDVSLAEVSDAYLAYVESLPKLPLAETSQFVLVASTLLLIKSRSLLPTLDLTENERESVEELERRLARLKSVREAAKILRNDWGTRSLIFALRAPVSVPVFSPQEASVSTIHAAAAKLINLLPKPEKMTQASVAPVLALEDVISQLKVRLSRAVKTSWNDLTRNASKHDSIVHFLAVLELVRSGSASVTQDRLFSDIFIESDSVGTGLPRYGL